MDMFLSFLFLFFCCFFLLWSRDTN